MQTRELDKKWWKGFQKGLNFKLENENLTVYIYDPPHYSDKEVKAELNPHTPLGHELSHMLSGALFFKGFDPSGAYIWGEKIDDSFDPGRALYFECWVIHGQVITDPNVDIDFKIEHFNKGRAFLEETFQVLYNVPISQKWLDRWDELKDKIEDMTQFRKDLPFDPWFPSKFKTVKLAKLES